MKRFLQATDVNGDVMMMEMEMEMMMMMMMMIRSLLLYSKVKHLPASHV